MTTTTWIGTAEAWGRSHRLQVRARSLSEAKRKIRRALGLLPYHRLTATRVRPAAQ